MKKRLMVVCNSSSSSFIISTASGLDGVKNLILRDRWESLEPEQFKSYLRDELNSSYDTYFEPGRVNRYCWSGPDQHTLQPVVYKNDDEFIADVKDGIFDGIPERLKNEMYPTPDNPDKMDTFKNIVEGYQARIVQYSKMKSSKYVHEEYMRVRNESNAASQFVTDKVLDIIFNNVNFGDAYIISAADDEYSFSDGDSDGCNDEEYVRESFGDIQCDFKLQVSCH